MMKSEWGSVAQCGIVWKVWNGVWKIPHWGSAPYQDYNKVANWIPLFI